MLIGILFDSDCLGTLVGAVVLVWSMVAMVVYRHSVLANGEVQRR